MFLFVWSLLSQSRKSHSNGDVNIAGDHKGEGLTYTLKSWPLSNEGSLMCRTYCVTDLLIIIVISEDPWHRCRAFGSGAVTTCFSDLCLFRPGIEPRSLACEADSQPLHHCGGFFFFSFYQLIKRKYGLSANFSRPTNFEGGHIFVALGSS